MPSSGSGICKTPQKQIEGCKNSENAVVNGFKVPAPSPCKTPKYKKPPPAKIERRESKLWRDSVDGNIKELLNEKEMSRQEVIHELLQGEEDLIQDLQNVKKVYHDGMKTLHLMTEDELKQIFGIIEELVPIHKDLVSKLSSQKNTEGSIDSIGKILVDWVSFKNPSKGQAHTLQANDEHDKKQWLSSIEAVINGSALREKEEQDVQFRTNGDISLPVFI
ncbi:rho guanine nucleotide exchange factor 3-like [Lingula anatina]|uniref:Rho guanine nucleotide exchange factor 3-like n=1 Tax=Lingula anatina TaxID=7574 RepID=A0A2R2MJC4_LINAN|nr:rho guanine nucleotide exchange factor 3-like [Lingula anatina]|eukprot:XP_023930305.1 rho guanine nucleotide exchange factor 3-like [Lingula anatina]